MTPNGMDKAKLTGSQAEMLAACIKTGAAWTTSRRENENLSLLRAWASAGYVEEVNSPAEFLISYRFTPLGLTALSQLDGGKQ